jgi:hypothetical protein
MTYLSFSRRILEQFLKEGSIVGLNNYEILIGTVTVALYLRKLVYGLYRIDDSFSTVKIL